MISDDQFAQFGEQFVQAVPHCKHLNMSIVSAGRQGVEMLLPYDPRLVGNPETGVIHSGVITTVMDSCCGLSAIAALDGLEVCPTLDLRIDHMTAAVPGQPVYAFAEAYHLTKTIVFTRGMAYQEHRDQPVAQAVGTFMRVGRPFGTSQRGQNNQGVGDES